MKKLTPLLLTLLLCLSLASCGPETVEVGEVGNKSPGSQGDSWAIYWYLCGSDLETYYGCATSDIAEMLEVSLPDDVKVVFQTGGAQTWNNDFVDASGIQRYVYDNEGLFLLDSQPSANMGDPASLADFLSFCAEHYPADRTMVLFWNHGGGSVTGAAFDELYGFDSLTLDEMYAAFEQVYTLAPDNPPIEVIGFDTCLMATIDVADTFRDIGRYLVASEELEPGNGWYYTGWLEDLAADSSMDGEELGIAICDSFREGCEMVGTADEITLSVTDLSRVPRLVQAYEAIGAEALTTALEDPSFFSTFGREAMRSESYGGNTPDQGYTNMVDLGHLVRNSADILPENADALLSALDECVVYQVTGPYRSEATGLSCYYSFNGDLNDFYGYTNVGASEAFKYLYGYELGGELSEAGMDYINALGYEEEELPVIPTLETEEVTEDAYDITVNDDGYAVLDLGPEVANLLKGVYFHLAYVDEEEDIMLLLGRDNDIDMNWDTGVFLDNFRGVWGSIDGYLVYMEIVYEGEDYNTYNVPILIGEEEYNLRVIYDYNDEAYYILGARKGLDDTGMADKNLRQLQPGDEITTLHYASSVSGDDDFVSVPIDTFTVTEETSFYEVDMGDGMFVMMFELIDARNEAIYPEDLVCFEVEGEDIYTSVIEGDESYDEPYDEGDDAPAGEGWWSQLDENWTQSDWEGPDEDGIWSIWDEESECYYFYDETDGTFGAMDLDEVFYLLDGETGEWIVLSE